MHPECFFRAALLAGVLIAAVSPLGGGARAEESPLPPLSEDTWTAWLQCILPDREDGLWRTIPWIPTYADGIRESARQGKPMLLWGMNGHPLGCT